MPISRLSFASVYSTICTKSVVIAYINSYKQPLYFGIPGGSQHSQHTLEQSEHTTHGIKGRIYHSNVTPYLLRAEQVRVQAGRFQRYSTSALSKSPGRDGI